MDERYFIIAGEASGDKHAAELIRQIRLRDPHARIAGLGGDRMEAAGCYLYRHIRHMAFMGFAAVIAHRNEIRDNFRIAREALLNEQPRVLILIDYPSFNLRIADFCRRHLPDTKIVYYIPPKVWAWKKRRVHQIAKLCDEVLGIFPFEPAFYAKYGYRCTYVGNPTAEELGIGDRLLVIGDRTQTIALLPGSRESEIRHCLPKMLEAARRMKGYRIAVCAAPNIDEALYRPYLSGHETLTHDTYGTLQHASAAVVNSGTATLETALLGCPQVAVYHLVCSRLIGLLRWAQPIVFKIPYFTLVNILSGKEVIRECIAERFTVKNVADELQRLLTDAAYQKEMLASYEHLLTLLGDQPASVTAAERITSIASA